MSAAEVVDAFRGIPRLLVAGYAYLVWNTVNWFMDLPEPTSQHTFLISTIIGGAAAVFGLYVNSGSGWDRKSARKDLYIERHQPDQHEYNHSGRYNHYDRYQSEYPPNSRDIDFSFERRPRKRGYRSVEETPPAQFLSETSD